MGLLAAGNDGKPPGKLVGISVVVCFPPFRGFELGNPFMCVNLSYWCVFFLFFPSCQVRVVRFYQSCSSPPPPRLALLFLLLFLLLVLLRLLVRLLPLLFHFHVHCCLANSSPSSSPTSELGVHRCAPLDLNLGPSQLSVHRWTSTWDLPSSVCTAGHQRPDRMPEEMPDRMSDRMPEDMPDKMP